MSRPRNFKIRVDGQQHSAVECKQHAIDGQYCNDCPKCGSKYATLRIEVQQYGFDRMATVTVYKCCNCDVEWFKEEIWIDGEPKAARTPITER